MKYAPLLLLCFVLLVTAILSLRVPAKDFPGVYIALLVVLLIFHLTGFLLLQEKSVHSETYRDLYKWAQFFSGLAALTAAIYVNTVHDGDVGFLLIIGATAIGVAERGASFRHLIHAWRGQIHPAMDRLNIEACVLLACSVLILSTLHAALPITATAVNAAFGCYMFLRAVLQFAAAPGIVRHQAFYKGANHWLPAMPGIVCFTCLCVFLLLQQRELSRQPQVYEPAVMEQVEES